MWWFHHSQFSMFKEWFGTIHHVIPCVSRGNGGMKWPGYIRIRQVILIFPRKIWPWTRWTFKSRLVRSSRHHSAGTGTVRYAGQGTASSNLTDLSHSIHVIFQFWIVPKCSKSRRAASNGTVPSLKNIPSCRRPTLARARRATSTSDCPWFSQRSQPRARGNSQPCWVVRGNLPSILPYANHSPRINYEFSSWRHIPRVIPIPQDILPLKILCQWLSHIYILHHIIPIHWFHWYPINGITLSCGFPMNTIQSKDM